MAIWTHDQIVQAAQSVGFSTDGAQTIAAIALAESGGDTQAISPRNTNGTVDYGLVQINSVHFSEGAITQKQALSPFASLAYALKLSSNGTNFTPWSTFSNGAYEKYMQSPVSNGTVTGPDNPSNTGLTGVSSFLNNAGGEILLFVVAITLLGAGFYFLAK